MYSLLSVPTRKMPLSIRLPRTLASRISLVFLLLFFLLSASQYLVLNYLWRQAELERVQRVEWGLASKIATQLATQNQLGQDRAALEEALGRIVFLNPRIDVYLLDEQGYVLPIALDKNVAQLIEAYGKEAMRVPVSLLEEALGYNPQREYPILGPAIGFLEEETVFSVARFPVEGKAGYLYVMLEGPRWILASRSTEALYVLLGGAVLSVGIFFVVALLGVVILRAVTRRFTHITRVVSRLAGGELQARLKSSANDEIGELSQGINVMADRLVENIESLEARDRFRRNFLASVTHDLRTPITSIRGYVQRFERRQEAISAEKRSEYLAAMNRNIARLEAYVEELFEASSFDAKEQALELSYFCMASLIQNEVLPLVSPQVEAKKLSLVLQLESENNLVQADRGLLQRALVNLVQNAIAYTPECGQVVLSTVCKAGVLEVCVKDTGIGIEEDDLPHVFEAFYRAEKSRSRAVGGTGLGLYIVQQILEAHELEYRVESEVDKGTSFCFYIACHESGIDEESAHG